MKPTGTVLRLLCLLSLAGLPLAGLAASFVDAPHTNVCASCHDVHGGTFVDTANNLCRSCHFAGGPGEDMRNHIAPGGPVPVKCIQCHSPHDQGVGKFLRDRVKTPSGALVTVNPTGTQDPRLCMACHDGAGGATPIAWTASRHGEAPADAIDLGDGLKPIFEDAARGQYSLSCFECHQPHLGELPSLIRPRVNGAPVPAQSDAQATVKGACAACHALTPGHHHTQDVQAKAGGCTRCHPMVWDPELNAIVATFKGCFTAGCHVHGGFF